MNRQGRRFYISIVLWGRRRVITISLGPPK